MPGALWVIGMGLGDERDVTLKGADAIRAADVVFLEAYTSILGVPHAQLEAAFGVSIQLAHRETVESEAERILAPAREGKQVAFLVVGDPFCATTHTDLLLRARESGVVTHVVHNASIMNAAGACGLQLYSFGATVSIPFFRPEWQPDSFYDKIKYNAAGGMHTLALLGGWRRLCAPLLLRAPATCTCAAAPRTCPAASPPHPRAPALPCLAPPLPSQTSRSASPTTTCSRARAAWCTTPRAS